MRFRSPLKLPEKFPLKFKEMDQESKAMAGVLVAFAIVVLGAVGLSQGQAGTPSLGEPREKPNMTARSGGLPPAEVQAEDKKRAQAKKRKAEQAKAEASLDELADSIAGSSGGSSSKSSASDTPAGSTPKAQAPASTPVEQEPAEREESEEPEKAREVAPKPKPKPQPKPAPSTLTSARVRALKNGADISSVASQLGPSLSRGELASRYGKEASNGMLAQEPAGRPCRYYALAPGEPAPLVRLCFDANGHLLTREFVAPQG